nr:MULTISPECIES: hypothetical protein [unclassified Rathayibacter]
MQIPCGESARVEGGFGRLEADLLQERSKGLDGPRPGCEFDENLRIQIRPAAGPLLDELGEFGAVACDVHLAQAVEGEHGGIRDGVSADHLGLGDPSGPSPGPDRLEDVFLRSEEPEEAVVHVDVAGPFRVEESDGVILQNPRHIGDEPLLPPSESECGDEIPDLLRVDEHVGVARHARRAQLLLGEHRTLHTERPDADALSDVRGEGMGQLDGRRDAERSCVTHDALRAASTDASAAETMMWASASCTRNAETSSRIAARPLLKAPARWRAMSS